MWFSVFFWGSGLLIILSAMDVIPTPDSSFHVSRELVAAFGGIFLAGGLYALLHGITGLRRMRRARDRVTGPSRTGLVR